MSEVFDPEKVDRWEWAGDWGMEQGEDYVRSEDYDKLLEMYRAATRPSNGSHADTPIRSQEELSNFMNALELIRGRHA